jgi:hypothetical protein
MQGFSIYEERVAMSPRVPAEESYDMETETKHWRATLTTIHTKHDRLVRNHYIITTLHEVYCADLIQRNDKMTWAYDAADNVCYNLLSKSVCLICHPGLDQETG